VEFLFPKEEGGEDNNKKSPKDKFSPTAASASFSLHATNGWKYGNTENMDEPSGSFESQTDSESLGSRFEFFESIILPLVSQAKMLRSFQAGEKAKHQIAFEIEVVEQRKKEQEDEEKKKALPKYT